MTAETDIAAIDDGGANTAAEVRTALTSVLGRGNTLLYPVTPPAGSSVAPHVLSAENQATAPTFVADTVYAWPFVLPYDLDVNGLSLEVSSAGTANVRIGIWDGDGTGGLPSTLVQDSGELNCSTTGIKTGTFTQVPLLGGNLYWIGFLSDAASGTWNMRARVRGTIPLRWSLEGTLQSRAQDHVRESVVYGALGNLSNPVMSPVIPTPILLVTAV